MLSKDFFTHFSVQLKADGRVDFIFGFHHSIEAALRTAGSFPDCAVVDVNGNMTLPERRA